MANGNGVMQTKLLDMAIKQGSATVLAGLLLWAFWAVNVKQGSEERAMFVSTLRETATSNSESMKSIAASTEVVKDSVERQEATMSYISKELEHQTEMREVAMKTMTAFTDRVGAEREQREELLNKICDKLDQNNVDINNNGHTDPQ